MSELVEPLAAQAGASGALAKAVLAKAAAAKKAKKAIEKNLARTMIAIVLRNQDPADDTQTPDNTQTLIDGIPGAEAAIGAPIRRRLGVPQRGGLIIAPTGKSTEPDLSRRGSRSVACELFTFDGDRAGADGTGEIIARTPRLR